MLERILSGGQTGVDRAALDVAIGLGIPVGGWCPRGRRAEDGRIPRRYRLRETPSDRYAQRTAWNVRDADATLILTSGPLTRGTAFTQRMTVSHNRPVCVVDLAQTRAVAPVRRWLQRNNVRTLNIAGPRASTSPGIYDVAARFLGRLLSVSVSGSTAPVAGRRRARSSPKTATRTG
jgi:hypothetical protein